MHGYIRRRLRHLRCIGWWYWWLLLVRPFSLCDVALNSFTRSTPFFFFVAVVVVVASVARRIQVGMQMKVRREDLQG